MANSMDDADSKAAAQAKASAANNDAAAAGGVALGAAPPQGARTDTPPGKRARGELSLAATERQIAAFFALE
jgi:hypothetical protein